MTLSSAMRFAPSDEIRMIREQAGGPIIDSDGHHLEAMPVVLDLLREIGGPDLAQRAAVAPPFNDRPGVIPFRTGWGIPAANTLDRMTVQLPRLLYERLDELGIDFALLYPTLGLVDLAHTDEELRRGLARAYNTYYAEAFAGYRDRLEPVAVIPTFRPEEAVEELHHAVGLGLKTAVMTGVVPREVRPDGTRAPWMDTLGHGSLFDYDPLWAACEQLGVVPTFHGVGMGWGSRASAQNYVYNHIGSFAAAQEAVCRSLILGGVPHRFPKLRFAFLEGGVTWAAQLLADLIGHYEKRNRDAISLFDPAAVDFDLAASLLRDYSTGPLVGAQAALEAGLRRGAELAGGVVDDFEAAGFTSASDIVAIFADQFFFGCEGDDPLNGLAFNAGALPGGLPLNAMFASDIGHWDVPDMAGVLRETWEIVEDGHVGLPEFGAFVRDNVGRMLTDVNPSFFKSTAIAGSLQTPTKNIQGDKR